MSMFFVGVLPDSTNRDEGESYHHSCWTCYQNSLKVIVKGVINVLDPNIVFHSIGLDSLKGRFCKDTKIIVKGVYVEGKN